MPPTPYPAPQSIPQATLHLTSQSTPPPTCQPISHQHCPNLMVAPAPHITGLYLDRGLTTNSTVLYPLIQATQDFLKDPSPQAMTCIVRIMVLTTLHATQHPRVISQRAEGIRYSFVRVQVGYVLITCSVQLYTHHLHVLACAHVCTHVQLCIWFSTL